QLEKAFQIRTRLLGLEHPDAVLTAAALAEAYNGVARKHDAEQLLIDAIGAARRSSKSLSRGMGEALYMRGFMLLMDGRAAEALTNLNEAIEVLRRTTDENDVIITEVMWSVASATEALGLDKAGALWEEGRRRSERLHGAEHPLTAAFMHQQAMLFKEQGNWAKAASQLEEVVAIQTRAMGPDDLFTLSTED